MDAQFLSAAALVIAGITAWMAIRKQGGEYTGKGRVGQLEDEIQKLSSKIDAQQLQIDHLLLLLNEKDYKILALEKQIAVGFSIVPEKRKSSSILILLPTSDLNTTPEVEAVFGTGLSYDVLRGVTRSSLLEEMDRLRNGSTSPDILHFSGHATKEYVIFDDGNVHAGWWRNIAQEFPIGLIFLNSCESLAIVDAMMDGGAKSAIGMRSDIPDKVAIQFAREFYRYLGMGWTVERAGNRAKWTLDHAEAELIKVRGDWTVSR